MSYTMDDLRELKVESEVRKVRIAAAKEHLDSLYAERVEMWAEADELGIPRATMARYSGCDAMIVSRALRLGGSDGII